MIDTADYLRKTAGALISDEIEDGGVSSTMLSIAADEIDELRSTIRLFVSVCNTAKPTALMAELSMAVDVANRTLKART